MTLYKCLNDSATNDSFDQATIQHHWEFVSQLRSLNRPDVMAATMIYGGRHGLLSEREFEELIALANKAVANYNAHLVAPASIRTLHAHLSKIPSEL